MKNKKFSKIKFNNFLWQAFYIKLHLIFGLKIIYFNMNIYLTATINQYKNKI